MKPLAILALTVVVLPITLWMRRLGRAGRDYQDMTELLLQAFEKPRSLSEERFGQVRELGYQTAAEQNEDIRPGHARVLHREHAELLRLHWLHQGALLHIHEDVHPHGDPLYLEAWDDNGLIMRPIHTLHDGTILRAAPVWRGAAWLDSQTLITEHRVENGLVLHLRNFDCGRSALTLFTRLPAALPTATGQCRLSAWVCLIYRLFERQDAAQVLCELENEWADRYDPPHFAAVRPSAIYATMTETQLLLEGALRFDIYALSEVFVAIARRKITMRDEFQKGIRAIFICLDAFSIWEGEDLDSAAIQWRHQEAIRELGLQQPVDEARVREHLADERARSDEEALDSDETGLGDLAILRKQRARAAEENIRWARAQSTDQNLPVDEAENA